MEDHDPAEEWVSAGDAAAHLGLPLRVVLAMARTGRLPAMKGPLGAPRFEVRALEAMRKLRVLAVDDLERLAANHADDIAVAREL